MNFKIKDARESKQTGVKGDSDWANSNLYAGRQKENHVSKAAGIPVEAGGGLGV
jgi:hypothetical protein